MYIMNLFDPITDVSKYCWLFKVGAIVNFAFFALSVFFLVYKIFTFKSKTRVSLLYYNITSALGFLFSYFLWRVLYSMCSMSGSSSGASSKVAIGGISGY